MSSTRTADRLSRLLAMLPWVVANPGTSVGELQERFGYQRRADLMRDLNLVFVCGLPGYGPGDLIDMTVDDEEVYIDLADYFARPVRLTAPEALMLLASGTAALSSGTAPAALASAVAKLRAVIAPEEGILDIDLDPDPVLETLRVALDRAAVVTITHTSMATGSTTTRDVEPTAVFTTMGNWYLNAWCRSIAEYRTFRVDRIKEATITDRSFDRRDDAPAATVSYTPGPNDVTATIRLSPSARWLLDYYPVTVLEDDGRDAVIVFSAADPAVAARILVKLGATAELLSGDEVSEALDDLRRRMLARYGY